MNQLSFAEREYGYEINGVRHSFSQTEFVVDGEFLNIRLGIDHLMPWFGLTRLTGSALADGSRIREMVGLCRPSNQFENGRLVLFGCHCGCDYCGIVSCAVTRDGDKVIWSDIREEDDDAPLGLELKRIDDLVFAAEQMLKALKGLAVPPAHG